MSVRRLARTRGFLHHTAGPAVRHECGIALVIVLFVVALVTVLVLEYHFDAAVELDLAANYASDVQAYYLALAGTGLAQALLQADKTQSSDGPEDLWHEENLKQLGCLTPQQLLELAASLGGTGSGSLGSPASTSSDLGALQGTSLEALQGAGGCVALRIVDEDHKLPVNALRPASPAAPGTTTPAPPDPTWVAIFTALGLQPDQVAALVDWVDDLDDVSQIEGGAGAESPYYQQLKPPYKSRNGPMRTPGELRLVKDFNTTDVLSLLFGKHVEPTSHVDFGSPEMLLTPYPGSQRTAGGTPERPKVNLNTVDLLATESSTAVVLGALMNGILTSGGGDKIVQDILDERRLKFQDNKQFHNINEIDGIIGGLSAQDKTKLKNVVGVTSSYFRVESEGRVGQDVRDTIKKRIVMVLKRGSSGSSSPPGRSTSPGTSSQPTTVYFKVE